MQVYCPKHPKVLLRAMQYQELNKLAKARGKRQGIAVKTQWLYCTECDKCYKPKVSF